jgi:hypothetical protein
MSNKMKDICLVVFVTGILSLLLYVAINQNGWDNDSIQKWASENSCEVVSVERTFFDHGPFWFVDEDDRVYKVKVKDRLEHPRVTYFRFRPFGMDQEWSE